MSEGGLRWLRVHVRRTAEPGGVTSLSRTVYCPNRGARVSLDDCSGCGNRFAVDRRDRDVFLVCDVPEHAQVPPTEIEPDPTLVKTTGDVVADVMSADVVCVSPELTIRDLLQVFLERGISGAPVVEDGKPVGVVSKTDVVRVLQHRTEPHTVDVVGRTGAHYAIDLSGTPDIDGARVVDVMTPFTLSLSDETPLERAAAVMAYEGIHRVPVVSSSDEVVGLLTSIDVLRWVARRAGYVVPDRTAQQS